MNLEFNNGFVALLYGFPPDSVFKQSIYTAFEDINKKIKFSLELFEFCREKFEQLGFISRTAMNFKWMIESEYTDEQINAFLCIVEELILKIKSIDD